MAYWPLWVAIPSPLWVDGVRVSSSRMVGELGPAFLTGPPGVFARAGSGLLPALEMRGSAFGMESLVAIG